MCYPQNVRTTLDLDEDLISVAKQLAQTRGVSLGQVISELARETLTRNIPQKVRNGVLLFTPKSNTVRSDLRTVNQLRDSE